MFLSQHNRWYCAFLPFHHTARCVFFTDLLRLHDCIYNLAPHSVSIVLALFFSPHEFLCSAYLGIVNSGPSKEGLNLPLIYPYKSANKPLSAPVLLHYMVTMGTKYAGADRGIPALMIKMSRTVHILRIHGDSLKEKKKTCMMTSACMISTAASLQRLLLVTRKVS